MSLLMIGLWVVVSLADSSPVDTPLCACSGIMRVRLIKSNSGVGRSNREASLQGANLENMLRSRTFLVVFLGVPFVLTLSSALLAQTSDGANAAAGAGGCALCGSLLMIPVVIFVLNIALLIWVARDAKARGMDGSVLWMLLVMFTSVIGLIIYLFARPQGNVVPCSNCHNRRLQVSLRCPHCGNA